MSGGGGGAGCPGGGGATRTSVSPLAYNRPCDARTPSAFRRCSSTFVVRTRNGRSPAVRFASPVVNAPTAENDLLISLNSMYSGGDTQNCKNPSAGNCVVRYINRSGCG